MPLQTYASHTQEIEAFGLGYPSGRVDRDKAVLSSWRRCIDHHRLDPAQTCEAYIVPEGQLRAHQEESEPLIRIARSGLERLYQQLKGLDYVLLLADRHGVAVDFLGQQLQASDLRHAGLYLGAEWREDRAGTSAVGACLATGEALIVHQSDHFDFTHTQLSCTAAPIYDLRGELAAVLDLSLLKAPAERASQNLALNLVVAAARRVELANLMAQSRNDWVLRFSQSPDFLDVDPDAAISIDARGRIRATTHAGARTLAAAAGLDWRQRRTLIGQPLEHFFDIDLRHLPELRRNRPAQERIVRARDGNILFAHAMEPQRAPARSLTLSAPPPLPPALQALTAGDPAMDALLHKAARLAPQTLPVLVQGETGVGKEFLARALHASSGRSGAFVAINCAAIPEALLESELFGYLPGSWTGGASKGRTGLIEAAHGGTLFLDEIGDMPLALQAKLLRVLSESQVTPVGAREPRAVNLRVVSASHRSLATLVQAGQFRQDLLYRLNAAELHLPPLRQRQDLGAMLDRLLAALGPYRLSEPARAALMAHHWPGNLRELHNVLRYATALGGDPEGTDLAGEGTLDLHHLPDALQAARPGAPAGGSPSIPVRTPDGKASQTSDALEQLLAQCQGNVSEVARLLGVNRSTVHRRIQRLLGPRQVRWDGRGPRP
ncbi:sigma-54-dependent Fis family transcriptional regulator [Xenophilus sp. Marseille-Q4582]|uniref:sigma-54-dependent Fis family transcriptional regulator n=1 Tax=Xenophilus sp. Marseille-Q4582 TaxID=2866600 RepID=UPI001CE44A48|nr:sigma-54-dependent Fis family transcriptional regulator [Xenophilus sp. Marseille-Q4582]